MTDAIPQRYRDAAAALPPCNRPMRQSRDSAVGYTGTTEAGRVCTFRCVTCSDAHPLRGDHGRPAPDRYFGEDARNFTNIAAKLDAAGGPDWWLGEACDYCGTSVLDLSYRCQAEYEAQQERWSRERVGHPALVEYGIRSEPRCRVY